MSISIQRMSACIARFLLSLSLFAVSAFALAQSTSQPAAVSADAPPRLLLVAAENFYGDVLAQLGGKHVTVTSLITQPNQDPHLFEASPSTARQLANARLVVYNGADYDPWLPKLLAASKAPQREQIVVASLVGKEAGDNPHLWYLPETMPALGAAVTAFLIRADKTHQDDYNARLTAFLASLKPIETKIAALREKYRGTPVTATEPILGYLMEALELKVSNARFQQAIMNDTEPSAADIAAFETDLRQRRVNVLIYNAQTSDEMTRHMLKLARAARIAVVNVSETKPADISYQAWILSQLNALEQALAGPPK